MVDTGQIFQLALFVPFHQIAGTVEARAVLTEWVGHETVTAEVGTPQIAPRQADAAHIQLTRHPHGHVPQLFVQNVHAPAAHWIADGHVQRPFAFAFALLPDAHAGGNDGFGRPIGVDDTLGPQLVHDVAVVVATEGLAADDAHAHRQLARLQVVAELAHVGGRKIDDRQPAPLDALFEVIGLQQDVRCDPDAGAADQRHDPQVTGGIEAEREGVQRPVIGPHVENVGNGLDVHGQRAMGHRHALGRPGGAGGIDDVGQVFPMQCDIRVVCRIALPVDVFR